MTLQDLWRKTFGLAPGAEGRRGAAWRDELASIEEWLGGIPKSK